MENTQEQSNKIFPYPCARCGFCCLNETCPVGQLRYGIGKYDKCPGLYFRDNEAICEHALQDPKIIGVGAGCCIKARAIKNGVTYEFSSLPKEVKIRIVQQIIGR